MCTKGALHITASLMSNPIITRLRLTKLDRGSLGTVHLLMTVSQILQPAQANGKQPQIAGGSPIGPSIRMPKITIRTVRM